MTKHTDEDELRALFAEIEPPAGLDRWRERIADVHAEPHDPLPEAVDLEDLDDLEDLEDLDLAGEDERSAAAVITLPVAVELRPRRHRKRSVAVAAAAAVIVGLGGGVVTSQLLTDSPPADPTMIIDGPDKTVSSAPPPTSKTSPSGSVTAQPTTLGQPPPTGGETAGGEKENGGPGGTGPAPGSAGGGEPSWPAMVGEPSPANTGVPLGATLGDHHGDLRVTTAGRVVTDLRVTGSVIVDAPNVTLRRIIVVAPYGVPAVQQNAGGLTIENSELSGGTSLTQRAGGLVVRRSRLESGATVTSGAELHDSYLAAADVLVPARTNNLLLRHSVVGRVTMNDLDGPIRGVTIDNGVLTQVDAPTEQGSASIHVLNNRFRGSAPSTGWNPAAPDYRWSGNTFLDSGAPANP